MFQKNLVDIELWAEQYFDRDTPAVTTLLQTVQSLKSEELSPALPDISASLRELRVWMEQQKNVAYLSQQSTLSQFDHIQHEGNTP